MLALLVATVLFTANIDFRLNPLVSLQTAGNNIVLTATATPRWDTLSATVNCRSFDNRDRQQESQDLVWQDMKVGGTYMAQASFRANSVVRIHCDQGAITWH